MVHMTEVHWKQARRDQMLRAVLHPKIRYETERLRFRRVVGRCLVRISVGKKTTNLSVEQFARGVPNNF